MGDELKGLLVNLAAGAIIYLLLLLIAHKASRSWWIWGALVTCVFAIIFVALGPVFLPIFNTPQEAG